MKLIRLLSLLVLGAASCLVSDKGHAATERRVALVVGNGAYQHAAPLPNPANDAADLANVLRELGFEVIEARDVTRREFGQKVGEFARQATGAKTALLFYAGHGLQVNGRNYLVPIDAKLEHSSDLEFQAVDATRLIDTMQAEDRVNLVFLDACRDNPLSRTLARSMGTRSASMGQGLAKIDAGRGTLIAFATSPSNVALDGGGRNSPFTTALLKHIKTPGVDIHRVMTRVTADVEDLTNGTQSPWVHASLRREVVLNPTVSDAPVAIPAPVATAPAQRDPCGDSAVHFRATESFGTPAAYEDHIQRFPNCTFSGLARAKLAALKASEAANAARMQQEQQRRSAEGVGADCDRLAANPTDPRKPGTVAGVPYGQLQRHAAEAIAACEKAVGLAPTEPRYLYQLARATQVTDARKAFAMYLALEQQSYPAAFDNLGSLYQNGRGGQRNAAKALAAFKRGMELGDPSAATSYARATAPKTTAPQQANRDDDDPPPHTTRRAGSGPSDAEIARKLQEEDARRRANDESTKQFMNILGTGISNIPRR